MQCQIFALFLLCSAAAVAADGSVIFTMCVPEKYEKDCAKMMEDSASKNIPIACITGRDRFACIEKVGRNEADIVAVDPEDMYLAAQNQLISQNKYSVVEQIRTKEEPEAIYRYEAVAVVHKDLNINNVQGLRGLKSCHTGVGRNVGYKIPITKLTAMGILTDINDPEYSARENELRALSSLFKKGCLVGTWSPDPTINQRLKETYSNMCALCEKPEVCDYPDIYSGYEGALRCLAHNGGEVAWTKVIYVKRFFGLPVGVSPAVPTKESPTDFRYFCPDGTKVPIDANTKPCTWAARPWQGYMVNNDLKNPQAVQKELTELGDLGETEKSNWWANVMLLNDKTKAVPAPPVAPEEHLKQAKYWDVIERNSGAPERNARWCVWTEAALAKCRTFSRAAYSRDARPRINCLMEKDENSCLSTVRDGGADLVVLEGSSVLKAIREYNAIPIIAESYGAGSTKLNEKPAVAVVKKGSKINSLADIRGKKLCQSGYQNDFAGWIAPVHALIQKSLIKSENDFGDFIDSSCAPGAPATSKFCEQCVGNIDSNDDQVKEATKCKPTNAEAFNGGAGALRCLLSDKGDVAFLSLTALMQQIKNGSTSALKTSDLKLICPNGGQQEVDNWKSCYLGLEPPRIIVSFAGKAANKLEELTHGVLAASKLYSEKPDLLQLFGSWDGQPNLIFKDDAIGLVSTDNTWDRWGLWANLQDVYLTL
ncbi:transferrin [Prorops nasuta]|uniref:transferrin n=1 Tax=Prorops nasuta TaxID=863751 RepID=UPI0034CFF72E